MPRVCLLSSFEDQNNVCLFESSAMSPSLYDYLKVVEWPRNDIISSLSINRCNSSDPMDFCMSNLLKHSLTIHQKYIFLSPHFPRDIWVWDF